MVSSTTTDGAAKVYTCPVCSRQFNKKANLKVHSRKHTGEKPYACSRPGCDRRFMWKSSVTFHEQNCVVGGRDAACRPASSGTRSVQKRHKMIGKEELLSATTSTPRDSPPRPHVTNIQNPGIIPTQPMASFAADTHDMHNAEFLRHQVQSASGLAQHHQYLRLSNPALQAPQHPLAITRQSSGLPTTFPITQYAQGVGVSKATNVAARNTAHRAASADAAMFYPVSNLDAYEVQKQFTSMQQQSMSAPMSAPMNALPFHNVSLIPSPSPQPSSSLPPSFPTEANPLPAPSTILEKPLPTSGRPPVIPHALPKPYFTTNKNVTTDSVAKAEPSLSASSAKPPVMLGSRMKMPISMDLGDSDDEGPERIIGAQETFMRTGNIFTGFAPAPRCSPLPASSPIVCPGILPMPLSPLAPFSPLPADSPAHNAPNPVHPPLNQPVRSSTSNF